MLNEPVMEKLFAMRLHGMADGLKAQQRDPAAGELSFNERFAMLVDQQWTWRENQALARRLKAAKLRGNACIEEIAFRAPRGLDRSVTRAPAGIGLGIEPREHFRARAGRRGQKLHCGSAGSQSVPRRLLGVLCQIAVPVP